MGRSFSDFIRNATEGEKREVYERVMDRASAAQREKMKGADPKTGPNTAAGSDPAALPPPGSVNGPAER